VQALESGLNATGADIAAFNCLLMEVKTRRYNPFVLERELRAACERIGETSSERPRGYLRAWFAPQAADRLPRAAPVRVRAAGARRLPRARGRGRRGGDVARRDRSVFRRNRRDLPERAWLTAAGRTGGDRRQRPP